MSDTSVKLRPGECVLDLEYKPGIIADLVSRGGPWAFKSSGINDERFPIERREGVVSVRFVVIPGLELFNKRRYMIRRYWFEECLGKKGMRLPNAAEALLFIASDHQRGEETPLTAFVSGDSKSILCVAPNPKGGRNLNRTDRGVGYYPKHNYLAVVVDAQ